MSGCDTHMLGVGVCALLCGHGDSQRYARVACERCSVLFMAVQHLCEVLKFPLHFGAAAGSGGGGRRAPLYCVVLF
jgi:hypothetical protein